MSNKLNNFYEFGDFRLDPQTKILYHRNNPVPLKPKAVETLIVLVENAGEVIGKADLMNAVWSDAFVEENNLSVNIYALRKAFARCGGGEQIYIQTVSRRGFRFAVPVVKTGGASVDEKYSGENPAEKAAPDQTIDDGSVLTEQSSPENSPSDDEPAKIPADSYFQTSRDDKLRNRQSAIRKRRPVDLPFMRRNLALVALIIFSGVALGSSIYVLRENSTRAAESKNAPKNSPPERGTKNIQAYQFYLRGRELWQTRYNPKMSEGIEFFRRAIELDPNFAAPYLGIADSLSMMRNNAGDWRQAEEYTDKARRLAPDSAEVYATLGFISALNKWDWQAAENHFKHALELDPNSGKAHQWYATLLMIERRFDEAETHLKRAIEIEPLSPVYNADLCELYGYSKRGDEALAQCRRSNTINPDFHYVSVTEILIFQKRYREAAQERIRAEMQNGAGLSEAQNADWYRAFEKDGFPGWMRSELAAYKNQEDVLLGEYNTGIYYARLGDREKTLERLEKCFAGRALMLPFVNARPDFDFLRDDPRFQDLMRRTGL